MNRVKVGERKVVLNDRFLFQAGFHYTFLLVPMR
jgi:hypothetical protein